VTHYCGPLHHPVLHLIQTGLPICSSDVSYSALQLVYSWHYCWQFLCSFYPRKK